MLRTLTIKNYKSILDHTIDLGRINIFIGENGCGKTNILEAVALAGAALTRKLGSEELFIRGIRVARPSIMRSSFPGNSEEKIRIECGLLDNAGTTTPPVYLHIITNPQSSEMQLVHAENTIEIDHLIRPDVDPINREELVEAFQTLKNLSSESITRFVEALKRTSTPDGMRIFFDSLTLAIESPENRVRLASLLGDCAVYNASPLALRGLEIFSRRTPLGLYGESLDAAISSLKPNVWADVLERARCISWVENIVVDPTDELKYHGHKPGKSVSTLYFHDRHMHPENNTFSAENVNEGILHILFHLTLFVSTATPKVLGIDNIDTALNPQLCRDLIKQLAELAVKHDKQALITTHNPAILDGLNLHDDEQRLFVVYRDDDGHTLTRRIRAKPQPDGQALKLSELWMRGHLGGIPRNF